MSTTTSPQTPPATRARFDGTVRFNRPVCREHFLLRIGINPGQAPFPQTRPGQFIQLGCRPPTGDGQPGDEITGQCELEWTPGQPIRLCQAELTGRLALLRRPFSLSGRGEDSQGPWIEIVHRVVGVGTDWLSHLKENDPVDFIGPLGNQFNPAQGKSLAIMVGGGVGLPPMFYLSQTLANLKWDGVAFVGALTKDLLAVDLKTDQAPDPAGTPGLSVKQFAQFNHRSVVCTDDGSLGLKGRITLGLERFIAGLSQADKDRAVVFTCGPEPMMHAVADIARAAGIDCQVCMEQAMACGMGTCQSCIIKVDPSTLTKPEQAQGQTESGRPWRYKLACTDGPVFGADQIVW